MNPILAPRVPAIDGDGAQGLGGGVEQDVVDDGFVLEGDGGQLLRNSKHDVEIFAVEQLGLALLEPLRARQGLTLGAVPIAAAVESVALITAGLALLEVTA